MKLSEKIDFFTGVISSGNTPALGPVAEELKLLTIFVDGCTDFLFDKAVPNPHYIFRITNIQSADGVTCAVAAAMTWPQAIKRIAHIHPDYSYGRNAFDHFNIVMKKMVPGTQVVSEGWPKLGHDRLHLAHHQGHLVQAGPARLLGLGRRLRGHVQAGPPLRHVQEDEVREHHRLRRGPARDREGSPGGVIAGVHSNYYFNYPPGDRWPLNTQFVKKYFDRWKEYPNFQSEGAYSTLYMLKTAIERPTS